MKLKDLLSQELLNYSKITDDSRQVDENTLFVAVYDNYISDAKEKGAKDIVTQYDCDGIDIRTALSMLSRKMYPYQPKELIGVTGTNGKTSTVSYINQMWEKLGYKSASLGTIGLDFNGESVKTANTTLNSPELHKLINDITLQGCTHLAAEISSHAIALKRSASLTFSKVGFTNLTIDHLDFHKTLADYFSTKLQLFDNDLPAVLNADIPEYEELKRIHKGRIISYGKNGTDLKLLGRDINGHGQEIDAVIFGRTYHLKLNMIGEFQAMNYLLAVGLAGMDDNNILDNLEEITQSLKAPRGRIDYVGTLKNGASVYVDYAHTPDALEKLLENLRPHTTAKLAVVFGCGGDRDASKRPLMGEIADRLADRVYITDDNPRTENPADIRKAIMKTCRKGIEFDSRKNAIETAIKELSPYDILVIAGKGHEEGQTIGKIVYPFNDKTIAKEYITNEGL